MTHVKREELSKSWKKNTQKVSWVSQNLRLKMEGKVYIYRRGMPTVTIQTLKIQMNCIWKYNGYKNLNLTNQVKLSQRTEVEGKEIRRINRCERTK